MGESRDYNRSIRLGSRDFQLLEDLFWQRLLSSGQIRRLGYFNSQNRCNRRLSQLCRSNYISALPWAADITGGERLFSCSEPAKRMLEANGSIDASDRSGANR